MTFQILAYLFILFAWSRALFRFKDRSISLWELSLWTAIWAGAATVVAWPGLTGAIAVRLGIGRGADVVIYGAVLMLFYLSFRLYIKTNMAEREITRLVRAIALRDGK